MTLLELQEELLRLGRQGLRRRVGRCGCDGRRQRIGVLARAVAEEPGAGHLDPAAQRVRTLPRIGLEAQRTARQPGPADHRVLPGRVHRVPWRQEDIDRPILLGVLGLHALHAGEATLELGTGSRLELEVIGGEQQRVAVRIVELRGNRGTAVELEDRLLPALDQVAAKGLLSQPLHGHGPLAPQTAPGAAHDLGRVDGRKRPRVRAAEERDALVVDDAREQRVAHHEGPGAARFAHGALLVREQVPERHGLARLDADHLPYRQPGGLLGRQPAAFCPRHPPAVLLEVPLEHGLPLDAVLIHRPRDRELQGL